MQPGAAPEVGGDRTGARPRSPSDDRPRSRNRAARRVAPLRRALPRTPRTVSRSIAVSSPHDCTGDSEIVDDVPQAFADVRGRGRAPLDRALGRRHRAGRATSSSRTPTSTGRASTCASATSAGFPSTTPTPTRAWRATCSSTRSSRARSTRCADAGDTTDAAASAYDALVREVAADRPCAPRARPRRPHRVAVPRIARARGARAPRGRRTGDDHHPHPRLTFTYPGARSDPSWSSSPSPATTSATRSPGPRRRRPPRGTRTAPARDLARRPPRPWDRGSQPVVGALAST